MARERLSMKFDSKTAGKTGQLLFLQKACSAIGGSPFRRPAPPPVSKESPPYPKLHNERSNDPVKHKAHETRCNNQIGANTIGIESPRA